MTTVDTSPRKRRMVPLRYVLTPFAIILGAFFLLIVFTMAAEKPAKKAVELKAPLVDVVDLQRQDIVFKVQSQGSVMPRTETTMISEVSGMVVEVSDKFKVGGYFKKGDQLLAIDDITYQVALVQAQSRLDAAEAALIEEKARTKQAEDEWRLSGKSLDEAPVLAIRIPQQKKAEADLLAAKADLKAAKIKLDRTKIIAPYDLMVKAKSVDIGQFVSTGSQLAMTFAVDYAEVRLPIKQNDVEFLDLPHFNQINELGSMVELSYRVQGTSHQWRSHLTRSEGVVDSKSRVHYVIAQVNDPYVLSSDSKHDVLHMGTFVNATITGTSLDNLIAIPRSAVYGANTVFTADSTNRLHIHEVAQIRSDAEYVYTQQEFSADQRLVLTQLESPVEGMKLRINGEEPEIEEVAEQDEQSAEQGEG